MPRFFIPAAQIKQSHAALTGAEFHHLSHVLRLTVGDSLTLCDEHGRDHHGTILSLSATKAEIFLTASSLPEAPVFFLTLAQGVLKGQKMDLVIEKATEIGVQRIVPFFSVFTVAQLPADRRSERVSRWQRLAQSAAKQSGNPVPQITTPQAFADLLATIPDGVGKVLLYEKEQTLTLKAFAQTYPSFSSLCVIVGPEGGFAAGEVEQAQTAGFQIVGLGTRTLRAETASIVAVALCRFLWGEREIPPLP
ncbi:MAG: 16S rRNA (uracil(1498)-N(3))-methyltransferase [Deltaproteobacteria bacterium]|nr:16S rRNA (uracil(1498)-N(3))-methyltransferase [Deltaproteobacteria bacterium]